MSPTCDLLVRGGTVVPMVQRGEWFSGDVLIADGRIVEVIRGAAGEVDAREVLDAGDALVLPGFVQAHVHVVQSLLRHQADDLELLDWLARRTWPWEAALDGDAVEASAVLGIAELLAGGTTTALDFGTTHDHDRVFRQAERLGIRMISGKTHMNIGEGVPADLLEDEDASLAEAEALGRRWHGAADGRLRYAVAPRFALSCTRSLLERSASLARRHGWLLETHAAENRGEVAALEAATGRSTIAYLDEVGLTGEDVVLAHCVHLSAEEVERLAATRTRVCHCPGANLKLASGIADIPRLMSAGIPVALGADGPPCNNRLSVFHEMSLAATLHTLRYGPRAMDAWTVLGLATRDGARALHLEHEIGTLEPGKAADLVVLGLEGWSMLPGGDPASRVVYGASAADVRHVVVAGTPVLRDRRLAAAPEQELREQVRSAWRATRARLEEAS